MSVRGTEAAGLPRSLDSGAFPIQPPANHWDARRASGLSALERLAYRSNLLGADRSVANWGGGNTSCKTIEVDFRGRPTPVLWVKGSGSDLATIRPDQFTGLRMDDLLPLLDREWMADEDLVNYYEHAGLRPRQPRASIETPLHSMLAFSHVDHTHPDAIIALCGAPGGRALADRLWDGAVIWVDYERPGFALGKKIALAVRERPDATCVLMAKHGLVTWADTDEECYARTIGTIGRAAEALAERADRRRVFAVGGQHPSVSRQALVAALPALRGAMSQRQPMVLRLDTSHIARAFASRSDVAELASAGPACPDHLVHTRPWPLVLDAAALGDDADSLARAFRDGVTDFEKRYAAYFARNAGGADVAMRDPAPRVVLLPGVGVVNAGPEASQAAVVASLYERAIAVLSATAGLDGFAPLTEAETFDVEYWPMELYKLSLLP
ncbi:MAG: class II aldolase/adducin family protein, partial [Actinobacteria bacterium]|nr:class II aldolase/adducin family protein [Actinomycetota bacterium]